MPPNRRRPALPFMLLVACACAGAGEIAVPGYPPIADPDDLGARSAVILFLKEKAVAYPVGCSDEHLLQLYRGFWDARRRPAAGPPPPPPAEGRPRGVPADHERANLELQLRRDYRYVNTAGKDLDDLRRVLADFQRRDQRGAPPETSPAVAPARSAPPSTAIPPAAATPDPATVPSTGARVQQPAPAELPPSTPTPSPLANPRNQLLPLVGELKTAVKAGDMEAHLQLVRRILYGLEIRQDDKMLHELTFALGNSKEGVALLNELAAGGDEVAEYVLWRIHPCVDSGTSPDDPAAMATVASAERWLYAAAGHGLPAAQYSLSSLMFAGTSNTPADPGQSARLERTAAAAGCLQAIEAQLRNPKMPKEERLAWQRLQAGLRAGSGDRNDPETIIRKAHEAGETTEGEFTRQLYYLEALRGSVQAQFLLGNFSTARNPTAEQDRMARFWLGAAALRGHRNAMIILAGVLDRTPFNPPDPVVPYTWLIRAANGTRPTGPEWERIEARISKEQLEIAFADARAWQPIPADTPLVIPPECEVRPPTALGRWPDQQPAGQRP